MKHGHTKASQWKDQRKLKIKMMIPVVSFKCMKSKGYFIWMFCSMLLKTDSCYMLKLFYRVCILLVSPLYHSRSCRIYWNRMYFSVWVVSCSFRVHILHFSLPFYIMCMFYFCLWYIEIIHNAILSSSGLFWDVYSMAIQSSDANAQTVHLYARNHSNTSWLNLHLIQKSSFKKKNVRSLELWFSPTREKDEYNSL